MRKNIRQTKVEGHLTKSCQGHPKQEKCEKLPQPRGVRGAMTT